MIGNCPSPVDSAAPSSRCRRSSVSGTLCSAVTEREAAAHSDGAPCCAWRGARQHRGMVYDGLERGARLHADCCLSCRLPCTKPQHCRRCRSGGTRTLMSVGHRDLNPACLPFPPHSPAVTALRPRTDKARDRVANPCTAVTPYTERCAVKRSSRYPRNSPSRPTWWEFATCGIQLAENDQVEVVAGPAGDAKVREQGVGEASGGVRRPLWG